MRYKRDRMFTSETSRKYTALKKVVEGPDTLISKKTPTPDPLR